MNIRECWGKSELAIQSISRFVPVSQVLPWGYSCPRSTGAALAQPRSAPALSPDEKKTKARARDQRHPRNAYNRAYHVANRESGWLTWWLIGLPAARPGSRPNERCLTFPLAAGPAQLHGSGPNLRPVASLVRQHHHTDPLRPDGQGGRRAPLAPGQGPRPQHPRPPRRRWRCIALIFDFLNHRTGRPTPVAAKAGVCVRTVATALKRLRERGSSTGCAAAPSVGPMAASCWSRRPMPLPCCGAIVRHRRPHRPLRATWGERPCTHACQRSPRRLRRPSLRPRRTCWRSAVPAMPCDPQDRPRPWPPRLI